MATKKSTAIAKTKDNRPETGREQGGAACRHRKLAGNQENAGCRIRHRPLRAGFGERERPKAAYTGDHAQLSGQAQVFSK